MKPAGVSVPFPRLVEVVAVVGAVTDMLEVVLVEDVEATTEAEGTESDGKPELKTVEAAFENLCLNRGGNTMGGFALFSSARTGEA